VQTRSHTQSGFSLIEVVVAVAVIAVLGGILTPVVGRYVTTSKCQSVVEDFKAIEAAMASYLADIRTLEPLKDITYFEAEPGSKTARHFRSGDGQAGWDGPYLNAIQSKSAFGGRYDIDVFGPLSASIDLGGKADLGTSYTAVLEFLNGVLDGDGDLQKGTVWGDADGIHYGFNYIRQ